MSADPFLPTHPQISGAKLPLRPMHVWGIRVRLQFERRHRDLALFDVAIDSKLRGCDVTALRVSDVVTAGTPQRPANVLQQKTGLPVQFELTDQARQSISRWLDHRRAKEDSWLFPSRQRPGRHLSTRQHSRLVKQWVASNCSCDVRDRWKGEIAFAKGSGKCPDPKAGDWRVRRPRFPER
jgi:hypothetical protein